MSSRYNLRARTPKPAPLEAAPTVKAKPTPKSKVKSESGDNVATATTAKKRKLDTVKSKDTKQPTPKKTKATVAASPDKTASIARPVPRPTPKVKTRTNTNAPTSVTERKLDIKSTRIKVTPAKPAKTAKATRKAKAKDEEQEVPEKAQLPGIKDNQKEPQDQFHGAPTAPPAGDPTTRAPEAAIGGPPPPPPGPFPSPWGATVARSFVEHRHQLARAKAEAEGARRAEAQHAEEGLARGFPGFSVPDPPRPWPAPSYSGPEESLLPPGVEQEEAEAREREEAFAKGREVVLTTPKWRAGNVAAGGEGVFDVAEVPVRQERTDSEETAFVSPTTVRPRPARLSPTKRAVGTKIPEIEVAPKSPKKDVAPKSPKKEVVQTSPAKTTAQILQRLVENTAAETLNKGRDTRSRSPEKSAAASRDLGKASTPASLGECPHVRLHNQKKDAASSKSINQPEGGATPPPKSLERPASPGCLTSSAKGVAAQPRKNPERPPSPRRKIPENTLAPRQAQSPGKSAIRRLTLPSSPTNGMQIATKVFPEEPKGPAGAGSSTATFASGTLPGLNVSQTGVHVGTPLAAGASFHFPAPTSSAQQPEPSKGNHHLLSAKDDDKNKSLPRHMWPWFVNEILAENNKIAHKLAQASPNILKAELLDFATLPPADPKLASGFMISMSDSRRHAGFDRINPKIPTELDELVEFPYSTFIRVHEGSPIERTIVGYPNDGEKKWFKDPVRQAQQSARPPPNRRELLVNVTNPWRPRMGCTYAQRLQEEHLSLNSTLGASLRDEHFAAEVPGARAAGGLRDLTAVYSPEVVLLRRDVGRWRGELLPAEEQRAVSVVTVAARKWQGTPAERRPETYYAAPPPPPSAADCAAAVAAAQADAGPEAASFLRNQIRLVLRVAAKYNHTRITLGDFGGAEAGNPARAVVKALLEVTREDEFRGGRWEFVALCVPERFVIKDLEGVDFYDNPDESSMDAAKLTITSLGKVPFKILQNYLDFQPV